MSDGPDATDGEGPVAEAPVRLGDVAYARSGDKADTLNVGVIARSDAAYRRIADQLTAERVATYLDGLVAGEVRRYELANLRAFNFVCTEALDGGGQRSLRYDSQGKTYAAALLCLELPSWNPSGDPPSE